MSKSKTISFSKSNIELPALSLTPLLDVLLILLIFFMLTSSAFVKKGIDIGLPSAESGERINTKSIAINIDQNGNVTVMGGIVPSGQKKELASKLSKINSKEIIVASEKTVPVQVLVDVLEAVKEAGKEAAVIEVKQSSR